MTRAETEPGFCYFVEEVETGRVKIGHTFRSVLARLAALQTGNPNRLRLMGCIIGDRKAEAALHRRFWRFRLNASHSNSWRNGKARSEWFSLDQNAFAEIETLITTNGVATP